MTLFWEWLKSFQDLFVGLGLPIVAAALGRLIWHSQEVKKNNRSFWSWLLLVEMVFAIFCGIIGAGTAEFFELGPKATAAAAGIAGYLGPRGMEVLLLKIVVRQKG